MHLYEDFIKHVLKGIIDHTENNHTAKHFRQIYPKRQTSGVLSVIELISSRYHNKVDRY